MNKLYILLALIIIIIIIIIYKQYNIEYFNDDEKITEDLNKKESIEKYNKEKEEKSALNYLSINTLIDISEKLNILKTTLNDTDVKLNFDLDILNYTKTAGTSGYQDQVDIINSKMTRLESFKTDIGIKILAIDELKNIIYEKLPKELILKIEELSDINIKYKSIYKDVIEITSKKDFVITKKLIMKELQELDKYLNEIKTILVDVITRFY
jgi:hypothetical protein